MVVPGLCCTANCSFSVVFYGHSSIPLGLLGEAARAWLALVAVTIAPLLAMKWQPSACVGLVGLLGCPSAGTALLCTPDKSWQHWGVETPQMSSSTPLSFPPLPWRTEQKLTQGKAHWNQLHKNPLLLWSGFQWKEISVFQRGMEESRIFLCGQVELQDFAELFDEERVQDSHLVPAHQHSQPSQQFTFFLCCRMSAASKTQGSLERLVKRPFYSLWYHLLGR